MFDDWIQILPIRFPLFQAFLRIALELLVLVLDVCFRFLSLSQLTKELLLSLLLLLLHLSLQVIGISLVQVLPKLLFI